MLLRMVIIYSKLVLPDMLYERSWNSYVVENNHINYQLQLLLFVLLMFARMCTRGLCVRMRVRASVADCVCGLGPSLSPLM